MSVTVDIFGRRQSARSYAGHCFGQIVELNRIVQMFEHLAELLRIGEFDQFVVMIWKFSGSNDKRGFVKFECSVLV